MATNGTSLIDANGLAKPVTKLIDAISKAIGTVYTPTHLKRMAHAQAECSLIETRALIAKEQLKERASERIINTEIKRQRNIDSISEKAFSELPDSVSDIPPDEDWMQEFFNLSQDVSDESLQLLWARILAGEVASPGKFSIRTMQLLKTLNSREATLFFDYCSGVFGFSGRNEKVYARIIGLKSNEILFGKMSHMEIIHLAEIGLVSYKEMSAVLKESVYQEFDRIEYFHRKFAIKDLFSIFSPTTWIYSMFYNGIIRLEFLTELGAELMIVAKGNYSEEQLDAARFDLDVAGCRLIDE